MGKDNVIKKKSDFFNKKVLKAIIESTDFTSGTLFLIINL